MKPAPHDTRDWVFDLDNTLYPAACNLFVQVDRRIQQYIMDLFGAGPEEARKIQKGFFHEYGTTLSGLMLNHGVDPPGISNTCTTSMSVRCSRTRRWMQCWRNYLAAS